MKRICIGLVVLLSASYAALAQSGAAQAGFRDIARYDNEAATLYPMRYVRNANNCGPDLSRAVFGPNGAILGYACYRNPNSR
jgi:hypothetical protein